MNPKTLDFKDGINFVWETVKNNWLTLTWITAIYYVLVFCANELVMIWNSQFITFTEANEKVRLPMTSEQAFLTFLFAVFSILFILYIWYSILKIQFKILNLERISILDFFPTSLSNFGKYILAGFAYCTLVVVGSLCFLIPGIYFALKYNFVLYNIVNEDFSITEAAEKSASMMSGNYWDVAIYKLMIFVVAGAILAFGVLLLVFGIIPAAFFAGWLITFSKIYSLQKLR